MLSAIRGTQIPLIRPSATFSRWEKGEVIVSSFRPRGDFSEIERDQAGVDAALSDLDAAARGTQNLLVPMKEALRRMATLGEVADTLRGVFGVYQPGG